MKKLLVVVDCLEMLALAVWVGGLMTIMAAVIPAVFNTMSMEAGGRMLTRTFQGYDRLVLISAGVLMVGLLARSQLSTNADARIGKEALLFTTMLSIAALLAFYLNPEIVRLQEAAFASQDETAKRSTYDAFFRLHKIARALYLLNFALGIAAICVKVRTWSR
jgi:uncharacterized membrane protein